MILLVWSAWALVQSGSLGACAGVTVAAVLAVTSRWWERWEGRWVVAAIAGGFGVAFAMLLLLTRFMSPEAVGYLSGERLMIWWTALRMSLHHPVFGIGLENFYLRFNDFCPAAKTTEAVIHAHNLFLHFAAETGWPATIALMWALNAVYGKIRVSGAESGFRRALFLGTVACLVHNLADYGMMMVGISVTFWAILGTLVGTTRVEAEQAPARR
jgi:O-antigen ligase